MAHHKLNSKKTIKINVKNKIISAEKGGNANIVIHIRIVIQRTIFGRKGGLSGATSDKGRNRRSRRGNVLKQFVGCDQI